MASIGPCAPAVAQTESQEPPLAEARRLTLGFEASAGLAPIDSGFFNYTDYDASALRHVRASVTASMRLFGQAALLAEVRAASGEGVRASALYFRVRPWRGRAVDFQVGRVPPAFGAFARRSYAGDNPLISYPLGYQYLTTLRPDAVPASPDNLLAIRGRGWLLSLPIGSAALSHGLPIIATNRWDTGAQVRVGSEPMSLTVAVTNGTLCNPRVRDDNAGKQVVLRGEARPALGLILGASASRGAFLARHTLDALPAEARGPGDRQRALGLDAEYSRGYWLLRGEALSSEWQLPIGSVRATAVFFEGRYQILPGLYAAGRYDRMGFSRIQGTLFGGRPTTWDAPVTRVEAGAGYRVRRNLLVKAAYQHNWRDGGLVRSLGLVAGQVLLWY